jgi:hypothetical protein
VNAPLLSSNTQFSQAAIFWFGRVTASENYADVRVFYTSQSLRVRVSVFDRLLYSDNTPAPADLTAWDAVSLLIDMSAGMAGGLTSQAYRFDAQVNNSPTNMAAYQAGYRGTGSDWALASNPFTAVSGYRWESDTVGGINDGDNNRGWSVTYEIPFSSLGLSGAPASGASWNLGVVVYDRESLGSGTVDLKTWPENLNLYQPVTWGRLHFGLRNYVSPGRPVTGSTIIRDGLNGARVLDAAVGGTTGNLCPGDPNYIWNQWGNDNFGDSPTFNIQNQSDLADWPCFAKYYVSFPLSQIPPGKVIVKAELTLYLFGNSDPAQAEDSLIQVSRVAESWNELALTWNNAPLAIENIAQTVVSPSGPPWPRIPYRWDVSLAVAEAYSAGEWVHLVLYSPDGPYHSGKYFVASEDEYVNGEYFRPTLVVDWGNP